ncbi:MAG: inorganic pyrophosphatase Ppa [Deltaproteobacteria bacterium]|nr:inorganic pyrophosphatase Ppa [Deltaproteobacteria bacterium]MBW1962949.1 inorganic pyrophosphatase Ppa [Deltaproteobacteria bacterium]MBW2153576.1 inorganic pyrophosphatase Ppa [Deltaproteobacteria bacterium]
MQIPNYLQEAKKFEIQAYEKPKEFVTLRKSHVPFCGAPRKHPYDPDKVILIVDPLSTNTFYYEFRTEDISYIEELPSIVSIDGKAIAIVRLWIKKMSIGVRCIPFIVEETGLTSKIND